MSKVISPYKKQPEDSKQEEVLLDDEVLNKYKNIPKNSYKPYRDVKSDERYLKKQIEEEINEKV